MVNNKVIIITGASRGLGRILSVRLAELGGKIALVSITKKDLENVKAEISSKKGISEYFVCDVTNMNSVIRTLDDINNHFGTIDILVNNAGIWTTDELEETRPELIEKAFKVNSIAPIYLVKAVLPYLREKNRGHILNVISDAGTELPENKFWATYAATKWALVGYTKALIGALNKTSIKVTAFYPSGFESSIFETAGEKNAHDQPWMMRTHDVADAIVYILDRPEELWIKNVEMGKIQKIRETI